MTEPIVSVIVPTYNRKRFLNQTVTSILNQTFREFELLVIDNMSEDGTEEYVKGITDKRVRYFRNANGGIVAVNRNVGIRESHGDYIAFCDDDDWWEPDKLDHQIGLLSKSQMRWVYSGCGYYDEHLVKRVDSDTKLASLPEGHVFVKLLLNNFIASPTPIIHRSVLATVGHFDERIEVRNREDWDLWLRIAAQYPVGVVRKILAKYRVHPGSSIKNESRVRSMKAYLAVIDKARNLHAIKATRVFARAKTNIYLATGWQFLCAGERRMARECFRKAIKMTPFDIRSYLCFLGSLTSNGTVSLAARMRKNFRARAASE